MKQRFHYEATKDSYCENELGFCDSSHHGQFQWILKNLCRIIHADTRLNWISYWKIASARSAINAGIVIQNINDFEENIEILILLIIQEIGNDKHWILIDQCLYTCQKGTVL